MIEHMFEDGVRSGPEPAGGDGGGPSLAELQRESVGLVGIMLLTGAPVAGLPVAELLDQLAAWDRQAAWLAAQQTKLIDRIAGSIRAECAAEQQEQKARGLPVILTDQTIENEIEAEIATALRLAPTTAGRRVTAAEALCHQLTDTLTALGEGRITYWQAAAITEETTHLTAEAAAAVEALVLPHAARETVAGLRRRLRRTCMTVTPTDTSARARKAKAERTVTLQPGDDGMAVLQAIGPAPALQALFDALDITAGRAPAGDPRRMGARRFDALIDSAVRTLDNGQCPGEPRIAANVYVTMDLATLLGLNDNPAELHGYGPLPAPLARILASDNGWRRLISDPITGAPLDLGRLRRRPSAALADWIRVRDRVCLFPGCHRAARRSDLDHRDLVAEDGRTDKDKMAPLCPKHHRVRHAGWRYTRHPDRIVWLSPHGISYSRYLPEPDLTIPPNLKAVADLDLERDLDGQPHAGCSEWEPPAPAPTHVEPPQSESKQAEPPPYAGSESDARDYGPPGDEPPHVEPPPPERSESDAPNYGPPSDEPPHVEPPPYERSEFDAPNYGPPSDDPPTDDPGP